MLAKELRISVSTTKRAYEDLEAEGFSHTTVSYTHLELRPQHFYKIENDVDGPMFVTARGWEDLSAYLQAAGALELPADEAVIGQYLRHPDVARDFAAYWALYQKYKADYGVEDILQGKPFDTVLDLSLIHI